MTQVHKQDADILNILDMIDNIEATLKNKYQSIEPIEKLCSSLKFNIKTRSLHKYNNDNQLHNCLKESKKIHFGSGNDIKLDFVNIDLNNAANIFLDVRYDINIPDNSIEYIYSSHFVEHLEHKELLKHLKDCFRILEPGGTLRLGIPFFEKLFTNYYKKDFSRVNEIKSLLSDKFEIPESLICYMDLINRGVYEFGEHKIVMDYIKIHNLLILSGFHKENISETDFIDDIDMLSRKNQTFYVEAIKHQL